MPASMLPLKRRNLVAKSMRGLRGGVHQSRPTRADLKHELRRNLAESEPSLRRFHPSD